MTTMLLLLLSGALIGTGITLIWRDMHNKGRDAFVLSRDSKADAEPESDVEITVARPAVAAPLSVPTPAEILDPSRTLTSKLRIVGADTAQEKADLPLPDAARPAATAQQWAALQPVVGTAVEQVNFVLAKAGVAISTPGEPSWGTNKAYGSDRHILVGGQSLAWLRLECTPGGRLKASVGAHEDALAEQLNGDASALASSASIGRVSDLLSECLKPIASYAVRELPDAKQRASETDWKAVEPTVIAALKAGNGALSQAGARLVPLAPPTWDAELQHHRMLVAVQVFGNDIARMHIDRLGQELEVAVGLPDAHLADLGRRQRIPLQGMTMHALAEAIASCAWPAIARYREARRPA